MKKHNLKLSLVAALFSLLLPQVGFAAEAPKEEPKTDTNLEAALDALGTAGNQAPAGITSEEMFAVQTRFSPLRFRSEISVGGSRNFTSDSFLSSQSLDAAYRFYLSNRWYVSFAGNYVFNELTKGGEKGIQLSGIVPDVSVAKYRADFQVGYHLFYGKLRFSMDKVFYFDQYIALGPGMVWMLSGREVAAVADAGIAFWLGKNFSMRAGFKDYFYREKRLTSSSMEHNVMGYLQAGLVFGR